MLIYMLRYKLQIVARKGVARSSSGSFSLTRASPAPPFSSLQQVSLTRRSLSVQLNLAHVSVFVQRVPLTARIANLSRKKPEERVNREREKERKRRIDLFRPGKVRCFAFFFLS